MKAICVYCGSSSGNHPENQKQARKLGKTLARQGLTLVYGGSQYGLMGEVAQGALSAGGRAIGVLPEALRNREVAHPRLSARRKWPSSPTDLSPCRAVSAPWKK